MGKGRRAAVWVAGSALVLGAGLGAGVTASAVVGGAPAPVAEDQWGWNCLTMGNGVCGLGSAHVPNGDGGFGVVQRGGDGFGPTVAWWDGSVTTATPVQREAAWRGCVTNAEGGDASMFACDEAWQSGGERFRMDTPSRAWVRACIDEAWWGDDPDAATLAKCEG